MKKLILVITILISTQTFAGIVCEGTTGLGHNLKLTIEADSAKISVTRADGGSELETAYSRVNNLWDGHMTGLMTAPGLSVKYEDHYGCIKNVVITAMARPGSIQSISVPVCQGGDLPDEECGDGADVIYE